jgi:hypothetical protein
MSMAGDGGPWSSVCPSHVTANRGPTGPVPGASAGINRRSLSLNALSSKARSGGYAAKAQDDNCWTRISAPVDAVGSAILRGVRQDVSHFSAINRLPGANPWTICLSYERAVEDQALGTARTRTWLRPTRSIPAIMVQRQCIMPWTNLHGWLGGDVVS